MSRKERGVSLKRRCVGKYWLNILCAATLTLLRSLTAWAQLSTTASITGTVTDTSGGVVADATVHAINQETNVDTLAVTNSSGVFIVQGLTVGPYTVKVDKSGFQEFVETNVFLHPATVNTVNATLSPGSVSSEVRVSAGAVSVETSTSEISNQVESGQIGTLPLNGRNYQALAAVMPGVINSSAGSSLGSGGRSTQNALNINGLGNSRSFYVMDGVWNENTGNMSQTTIVPNPDTLDEVRVLQNNYSVRYSLMGSSVVILQSKSGTGTFHGSAFEYLRNDLLNSRNFFAPTVSTPTTPSIPPYKQNIFGYTVGGPLYIPRVYNTDKKKTFFFWSQQWVRLHAPASGAYPTGITATSDEYTAPYNVPSSTPIHVPGFSNCFYPANTNDTVSGAAAVYQLSPPGGASALIGANCPSTLPAINSNSVAFLKTLYPAPNFSGSGGVNFINERPQITNQRDDEIKIDHNFTSKFRLTAEYLGEHQTFQQDSLRGSQNGEISPLNWETDQTLNQIAEVQFTAMPTPSMMNTVTLAYNIFNLNLNLQGIDYTNQIPGFSETLPFSGYLSNRIPLVTFSNAGWGIMPQGIAAARPLHHAADLDDTISDDWSWQRGKHFLQAGLNVVLNTKRQNQALAPGTNGTWSFTGNYTNNALADFLFGDAVSFSQVGDQIRAAIHGTIISPYLEDRMQITRRLTLTTGLRVWHMPWPHTTAGTESLLIPANFDPANAPALSTSGQCVGPTGTTVSCPADYTNGLVINGQNGVPINFVNLHNWYYGPIVGFAWDVFGDGKTSLRGGYGITYTKVFTNQDCSFNCTVNPPFVQSTSLTGSTSTVTLPFPSPGGSGITPLRGVATLSIADPNAKATSVQSYSLSLEHQFRKDWLVTIAGAGSAARNVQTTQWNYNTPPPTMYNGATLTSTLYDFNPALNAGTSVNFYAPFRGYGSITTIATRIQSNWHALELSLRHPVKQDLFLTLAYTWSHDLSNQAGNSVVNIYKPNFDYGNAESLNFPQVFTATLTYDFPWFRHRGGFTGHILGGWKFSDLTTVRSGSSFSPSLTGSNLGPNSRPNVMQANYYPAHKTVQQWLNPNAFAPPNNGFYGNAPNGLLLGPGLVDFDMTLHKAFHIYESSVIEFRAEAFNVFNHPNFNNPNGQVGSSAFGTISSARDPRILELALRFGF